VVRAEDDQGNLGINFTDQVLMTIGANPAGGVLVGTTILSANQGITTFQGLSIDKAGSGYSLVAFTYTGLRFATSSPFAILPPSADLSLSLDGSPNPANPGDQLTYTLKVTNQGPSSAANITVTQTLPTGTNLVNAGGNGWTCAQLVSALSCTRSSLVVGSAPDLVVQVTAPATAGILKSSASVSALTADPNQENNTVSSSITVVIIPVTGKTNHLYIPQLFYR
jgi:uncharacterized repeat protein (TIGR01451 family)